MKKIICSLLLLTTAMITYGQTSNASSFLSSGKLDNAKKSIDNAILNDKESKKSKTWFVRGNIYRDINNSIIPMFKNLDKNAPRVAYESYKKAMELEPEKKGFYKSAEAALTALYSPLLNNAVGLYQEKNFKGSIEVLEMAETLSAQDTTAIVFLNQIAFEGEDFDKFLVYGEKCLAAKISDFQKVNIYARIIYVHKDKKKDLATAQTYLDKALAIYPKETVLWQIGAELYEQKQNPEQSLEFYKKATQAIPQEPVYQQNMGFAYYNKAAEFLREKREKVATLKTAKEKELVTKKYDDLAMAELKNAVPYLEKADNLLKAQKKTESLDVLDILRTCYSYLDMPDKEKIIVERMKILEKK